MPTSTKSIEKNFVDRFAEVVDLVLERQTDEAAERLSAIARLGSGADRPAPLPLPLQAAIFARDRYTCRYCDTRTVLIPVMYAISALYGSIFKAHRYWRRDETDIAYWTYATSVEHIVPVKRGGTNDPDNVITACWHCNEEKGTHTLLQLDWNVRPIAERAWDGLGSKLPSLIAVMDATPRLDTVMKTTRGYFEGWVQAIEHPHSLP
jgi:5-methylcytosine-specific restriction endonuclease McrA